MDDRDLGKILCAREKISSVLLLSELAEAGIENDTIDKVWDIYPFFVALKLLCEKTLEDLLEIDN